MMTIQGTGERFGAAIARKSVDESRYALNNRIYDSKWRTLVNVVNFHGDDNLFKLLPTVYDDVKISNNARERIGTEYVLIPLHGGGELRLARTKGKLSSGGDYGRLVVGITTQDPHGVKQVFDDFILHSVGVSDTLKYAVKFRDSTNKFLPEKESKEIDRFLAFFDPSRDVDLGRLGTPNSAQAAILKVFGVNLPASQTLSSGG